MPLRRRRRARAPTTWRWSSASISGVGQILAALDRLGPAQQHDRHLHQRQRRRVAVAQRAALPPQGDGVGGRHPRAGDHPLARTHPAGQRVRPGRHHDGPDGVDSRRGRRAVPPDARLEGINLLPILEGRAPEVERTLFWRVTRRRASSGGPQRRWKLVVDRRGRCCSTCAATSASAPTSSASTSTSHAAAGGADRLAGRRRRRSDVTSAVATPESFRRYWPR